VLLKHFKISKTAPTCFGLHQLEIKMLDIVDAQCNHEV